nr:hypothetical protein [Tanacetum cinerariifolium]
MEMGGPVKECSDEDGRAMVKHSSQMACSIDTEEKVMVLSKEREQLMKERDSSHQEALLWHSELAKARKRVVILKGALSGLMKRQEENTKQVLEEKGESCSEVDTQPLTKHVYPLM